MNLIRQYGQLLCVSALGADTAVAEVNSDQILVRASGPLRPHTPGGPTPPRPLPRAHRE